MTCYELIIPWLRLVIMIKLQGSYTWLLVDNTLAMISYYD